MWPFLLDLIRHAGARLSERTTILGIVVTVAPHVSPDAASMISSGVAALIGLALLLMPDPKLTASAVASPAGQVEIMVQSIVDQILARIHLAAPTQGNAP